MPVSGNEIASLDFANLIGGPLNAVVEAQAKSAITTVNFIKEVAFDKDKKIVNVDFNYNRKNNDGRDQQFTLTVPFLTMLPVPYITVNNALIEFNAKITSLNESNMSDDLSTNINADAGGRWWFASARVTSKTAYQKKTASSEKEERTFDMHVKVEAKNQDMPAGTERLLTILENSISEKPGDIKKLTAKVQSSTIQDTTSKIASLVVTCNDESIRNVKTFACGANIYDVDSVKRETKPGEWTLKFKPEDDKVTLTTGNELANKDIEY